MNNHNVYELMNRKQLIEILTESLFFLDIDAEKPDAEDASSAVATLAQLGPNLHKLWNYSCNLTKGRNVSCMAWNKLNPVSRKTEIEDFFDLCQCVQRV